MNKGRKINVLFLFHYSGLNNGAVRSMVDVISTLVHEEKIKAVVLYPDKKNSAIDYLENLGVECYHIFFPKIAFSASLSKIDYCKYKFKYHIKNLLSKIEYLKIKKIIQNNNIEIIYSNTSVINYGWWLSKKMHLPHVWHIREFGKEDHNLDFVKGRENFLSELNDSQQIIYISKSIFQKFKNDVRPDIKQNIIYNDISPEFINPKPEFNLSLNNPLNAVIIGTIQPGKGQLDVVKAVERLNKEKLKVILHIGGAKTGTYYELIKDYVNDHKLTNEIIFDGFITAVNLYRAKMDIGVVASKKEAFGRVTVEGMLSQLAMVGANSGGTSEIIKNNCTGLLYEKDNIEDLAEKINELYLNRDKLKKIALNGYKFAVKNFTVGKSANEIYNLLIDL